MKHLCGYFDEIGKFTINGMTELPLSWSDFYYWSRCTKRNLSSWEYQVMIEMSEYYLRYKNDPENIPPPFYSDEIKQQLIEVQSEHNKKLKQQQSE